LANNALYYGDNLEIMKELLKERKAFIDLVYIDPPFNSKRNYNILFKDRHEHDERAQVEAFTDTWSNVNYQDTIEEIQDVGVPGLDAYLSFVEEAKPPAYVSYLSMMAIRIYYMRQFLKPTGSFYLHCDPTMSHYLKIICDLIFGGDKFVNEIVWHYGKWSNAAKFFQRNHDIILFYSKGSSYKFNPQRQAFSPKTAIAPYARKVDERGVAVQDKSKPLDVDAKRAKGVAMHDTWDIPFIHPMSKERLGYPTQKPLSLLERIINASSDKGDIVADFFCGCGTTIDAAIDLKRKYIGVDISTLSISLIQKRINDAHQHTEKTHYDLHGLPVNIEQARKLAKENPLDFQVWVAYHLVGGIPNPKKTGDRGIDGWFYFRPRATDERYRCIIEVKGGANLNISQVRAFIKTVQEKPKRFGVFLTMGKITDGMRRECAKAGKIVGMQRCEIASIADLMDGKKPETVTLNATFPSAALKTQGYFEDPETD